MDETTASIGLAHDYLTQRGGAERVALAIANEFRASPVYTSVFNRATTFAEFQRHEVFTSPLQHLSLVRSNPRIALPLLPVIWSSMRPKPADVFIASSSGWAHGIPVPDGAIKIVYCHNPARWLYQSDEYIRSPAARASLLPLRRSLERWDKLAAYSADRYIANSTVVAERISTTYGLDSDVVYPPVSFDSGGVQEPVRGLSPGYWLTVARGRGYKNVGAIVDAVAKLGERLVVVGQPAPAGHGTYSRTSWLGIVPEPELRWLYANARALVSVSHEDFGLTPIEANAMGTPCAVLRRGGFLDSTAEHRSGVFIEDATIESICHTLRSFPDLARNGIVEHAKKFSVSSFGKRIREIIVEAVRSSGKGLVRL